MPNIDNLFPEKASTVKPAGRRSKLAKTRTNHFGQELQSNNSQINLVRNGSNFIAENTVGEGKSLPPNLTSILETKRTSSMDRNGSKINASTSNPYGLAQAANLVKTRKMFKDAPSIISPKTVEHWINETLGDAEHLNIPGVIMKPESKVPVYRYNIDRSTLMKGGIPNESINRIYRSLFVYSVGFYDLIVR